MKDVFEVLLQKTNDLNTVRRQVACLRVVAPLLADELESAIAQAQEAVTQREGATQP